jgi:hypothetical protein
LKHVSRKDLQPDEAKVYYLKKEGHETINEHQPINDKGQIESGLIHFYETGLEYFKEFFKRN